MVDSWMVKQLQPVLNHIALKWIPLRVGANAVTIFAFLIGMTALPLLWQKAYLFALGVILINRILDGMDGAIARRDGISDLGGYLDITCDFIFYSSVVFGFALADPAQNALSASFLIFSFIGTGTSFLGFAIFAAKRKLTSDRQKFKSIFYLGGLVEGTETILFFNLFC